MARKSRRLVDVVSALRPDLADAGQAIAGGQVLVDGRFVTNPASQVRAGAAVVVRDVAALRGEAKLAPALRHFGVPVTGRVALDCGAAAGGFTRVLLGAGARLVYAVDAGHGQLLGSLRQDQRVVDLEGTNLADLSPALIPEPVGVVTLDLSYLSLAEAVPQLERIDLTEDVDLVALVKPMFELRLATAPTDASSVQQAVDVASSALAEAGWNVRATMASPVTGARGAPEALLHARPSSDLTARPRGG